MSSNQDPPNFMVGSQWVAPKQWATVRQGAVLWGNPPQYAHPGDQVLLAVDEIAKLRASGVLIDPSANQGSPNGAA